MSKFKVCDDALCISPLDVDSVRVGSIYRVIHVHDGKHKAIAIKDDFGNELVCKQEFFSGVEQMNNENWKPKVGEPCDYGGVEGIPDHVGKELVIFTISTGVEQCDNIIKFKPIKTTAEIEQDRIIDKALNTLGHSRGDCTIVSILKQLYHANLLSDKQVKPLGYEEFEELYISTDYRPSLYKKLKPYTIQGGE